MKPRKSSPFRSHASITAAFSVALFSHFAAPLSSAATLFFGSGATQGGSGTWDTSTARWGSVAAGPYTTIWNNSNNDVAEFNVTTGTATLGSNVTVGGITVKTGAGGNAIAPGTGPFTVTLGLATTTFSNAANTTAGRNLTVNAEVTGSNNLSILGPSAAVAPAGTITLGAVNTFTGTLAISRTTLAIGASGQLNSGNYANTIAINTNGRFLYGSSLDQTLGGIISGTGVLTKGTSASTLTLTNINTYSGATGITSGTLALTGTGSVNNSSGITVNGSGSKLLQSSSAAITPAVTLTNGTLTGNGTVNTVNVGNATGGIVSNNNGVAGSPLTIGTLTFSGAATINTFGNASVPLVTTTLATNLAGQVTINPTAASWTTGTTYDLISYGGGSVAGDGFAQFVLGTVTGKTARQTATLINTGTTVAVQIGGSTDIPYWVGDTNNQWDTSTNNNWRLFTAGTYTDFISSDDVLFNDNATAVGPVTVNIDTANVATSTTTFNNSTKDYVLNSTGIFGISAGSLTKNGTGKVSLNTANTYIGGTTVNNGTLQLGNANAVSTGTLTFNGGNLDSSVANLINAGNNPQAWNSNFTFVGTENLDLGTGAVTMSSDRTLTVSAKTLTVGGIIDGGAFSLTKSGAGTLILPQINTYTGDTTISSGTLQLGDGLALNGSVAGNIVNNGTLVVANSTAQTLTNVISGSGNLTKPNAATLNLSGINTYSGVTTISAGTLTLGSSSALGSTSGLILGGALEATLNTSVNGITINAPITTADSGITSTIAFTRASTDTGTITLNGAIGGNGNVTFTTPNVNSGGNLQNINLGAASNYAGITTLNVGNSNNAMTVRNTSGAANALPSTTVLTFGTATGSGTSRATTYDLGGQNQTLAGLTNAGLVPVDRHQRVSSTAPATLTINNATAFTFGGSTLEVGGNTTTTRAQITGAIALTKTGVGTFTLGGTLLNSASVGGNTFTGDTKILGGVLVLGETTSIQNSALDTTASITGDATNGLRTAVTTLTLGGLSGNKNLASVFTSTSGGYSGVTALTLNPGTGATPSYSGGISDGTAGMTLTKTGAGTQTLSGANTYTGATTVSAGTLALVGGSQTSAITVSNLAALGFTPGSPTTSNSSVTFDTGSTVTIIGTPIPATTYTLLTTTATISGTPTLSPLVSGFELQIDGGNTLKLVPVAAGGYAAWQSANGTAQAANLDHDNDGVSNGVEHFLGGSTNTTGFTALPGVNTVGGLSVTWTKHPTYTGSYTTDFVVETSATLAGAWSTELADPAVGFTVTFPTTNEVKFTFPTPLGSKNFARLKVTGP